MFTLRKAAVTIGTVAGLLVASPALAANITVEQAGAPNALGSWVLRGPDSLNWNGNAAFRTVMVTASGMYTLNVVPPIGAPKVTMRLFAADGSLIEQTNDHSLSATFESTRDYRFTVEYGYEVLISIQSSPTGAPYSLENLQGRVVESGVTPDQVTAPAGTYTVKYGFMRGCSIPRPQNRTTGPSQIVEFFGRYECGPRSASSVSSRSSLSRSSRSSVRSSSSRSQISDVRVLLRPLQRETVPGGKVIYSLSIRNEGNVTQYDLVVRFRIDKAQMSLPEVPANAEIIDGQMVVWRVPELSAGRTWSTEFPVSVNRDVSQGTRLETAVTVVGPNVTGEASTTVGVTSLPATGVALDMLFVIATTLGALFLTFEHRRRQAVV